VNERAEGVDLTRAAAGITNFANKFNHLTLKGTAPPGSGSLVFESRSRHDGRADRQYGLIART